MRTLSHILTAFLVSLLVGPGAEATIHEVPGDYPTIQLAVDAAVDGDTVLVSAGTYVENVAVSSKSLVIVSSEGAGETTIRAIKRGVPVVRLDDAGGTVLDGFTITGGQARRGGGVWTRDGSPRIVRCVIRENMAVGKPSEGRGGGLYLLEGTPVVEECIISENDGVAGGGIAMATTASGASIQRCEILDNEAEYFGGGILLVDWAQAELLHVTVARNRAGIGGGGVFSYKAGFGRITSCTIDRNEADAGYGSGTFDHGPLWVENTIISNGRGGVGVYGSSSYPPAFLCCDGWNPDVGNYDGFSLNDPFDYFNNIVADPLYCDAENGNYWLQEGSPCADDPYCEQIGRYPVGCQGPEPGASGSDAEWETPATQELRLRLEPNPANSRVLLLTGRDHPGLAEIFDLQGRRIRHLPLSDSGATAWDLLDAADLPVVSGVYFVRVTSDAGSAIRRLLVIR